jgi:hypothetical protein
MLLSVSDSHLRAGLFDMKFHQFDPNILACRTLIAATSHFDVVCRRADEICCEPGRWVELTFTAVAWTTPLSVPKGIIRIECAELCTWNGSSFTEVVVANVWWDGGLFGRTTTWTGAAIIYFRIASSKSPNVLSRAELGFRKHTLLFPDVNSVQGEGHIWSGSVMLR